MSPHCRIAQESDLPAIVSLRSRAIGGVPMQPAARTRWADHDPSPDYRQMLENQAFWVVEDEQRLLGCAGLRLHNRELVATFIEPGAQGQGLGTRLVKAVEDRARQFLIRTLRLDAAPGSEAFYRARGYQPSCDGAPSSPVSDAGCRWMARKIQTGFDPYQQRIAQLHDELELPEHYGASRCLPLQPEAGQLKSIGEDLEGRDRQLRPDAADAWAGLSGAAAADGIALQLVSAFRSVDYQADIIRYKRNRGDSLEEILNVSALPGFSEHHTGRVVDVSTPGFEPLEEEFEQSPAFDWLQDHAAEHGFSLSYPRGNRHGIAYEPWHWAYTP